MSKVAQRMLWIAGSLCFLASSAMAAKNLQKPQITTLALPGGVAGQPYSAALSAQGGMKRYAWSIVGGSLPPGLVMNPSGTISGTPCGDAGTWWATFQVADPKHRTSQKSLAIFIGVNPLKIITRSLPNGYVGIAYLDQPMATGGVPICP